MINTSISAYNNENIFSKKICVLIHLLKAEDFNKGLDFNNLGKTLGRHVAKFKEKVSTAAL